MRAVYELIVKAPRSYNNTKDIGGETIVVNTSIDTVANINRIATVVSPVKGTILEVGDEVIIHHNIMREKTQFGGENLEFKGDYFLGDGHYCVTLPEVYMYKRGEGDWTALDPYCFVETIKYKKHINEYGIEILGLDYKERENQVGVLAYPNKKLEAAGIKKGQRVFFRDESEYEFEIDGKMLYMMDCRDIVGV